MSDRKIFKSNSVTDADVLAIAMEVGFDGRGSLSGKSETDELIYVAEEYPIGEMLFKFAELLLIKAGIFPDQLVDYYRIWVLEELVDKILSIIKRVPIIEELPDFYKELASLLVDIDKLRLTLGKLNGILPILHKIERESSKKLSQIELPRDADRIRRAAFGRISSIINKQNQRIYNLNFRVLQ